MTDQLLVPRELLVRALKADHAPGRSATELCDGWKALDELETLLAQPASEPKPVARVNKSRSGTFVDLFDRSLPDETELFTHPAPAGVVRKRIKLPGTQGDGPAMDGYESPYNAGWNACLDEVKRLNNL